MLIQGASVEVVQGASNEEQRVPRNSSWLVDVPFQLLVCHTFFFRDAWCWWLPFVTLLLYTVLQFLCSVLFCDYGQFRRWIILLIWNFFKLPQCELCQHFYSFRSGSACFGTTCSSLLTWSSMLTWRWRRRAVLRLCLRVLICASTCHSTFWPFRVRHDQSLVIRQAIQEFMLPTFCQNKPFSAATLARLHRWCFEVY